MSKFQMTELPLHKDHIAGPYNLHSIANRPMISMFIDLDSHYILNDEIHQWLRLQSIYYTLDYKFFAGQHIYSIKFLCDQHAMFFKLTWL